MKLTFSERKIIEKVQLEITTDFKRRFKIEDLCEQYKISETKLTKGFKQLFGITIARYHLELCMQFAKEEFIKGTTVGEIAFTLEYSSIATFSRAFKRVHNKAPSYYRFTGAVD
ncbi:helix-turn-helix domain-containing protein [Chitinophaga oryziterrae]|uniref:Helix-turn-helix domain-containing protein n=1 Tax=Chitinophaga oryziterrae TaxID=1031224 RepID=A0A6N8J4P6_9BACT|nr:AraC family transcriptional regulator [Chitinophaga oryziterrae]MVT40197.1 helix-turn-helix domain-containing protein [Chitinophaga oryziterrae]